MPADANKGTPRDFLINFLSRPASSIPKGAQWAVQFHDLRSISPAIQTSYNYEPGNPGDAFGWNTLATADHILQDEYQQRFGCLFCTAIDLPGEGGTPVNEGIKHGAYIRSFVGAGRKDFDVMRMSFIDTNVSFTDSFLRGWSLATSRFGMIAREGDQNYRTDMTCWKFGFTETGVTILQSFNFHGLCCIGVNNEEYNYDPATSYVRREAQFVYHYYGINTVRDNYFSRALNNSPLQNVRGLVRNANADAQTALGGPTRTSQNALNNFDNTGNLITNFNDRGDLIARNQAYNNDPFIQAQRRGANGALQTVFYNRRLASDFNTNFIGTGPNLLANQPTGASTLPPLPPAGLGSGPIA